MREALKGLKPSAEDVSAWLWWKSGTEKKPFPLEEVQARFHEAVPALGAPEREGLAELEQRLEQAQIQIREAELRAAAAEEQARLHEMAEAELREQVQAIDRKGVPPLASQHSRNGARSQGPKGAAEKPINLNDASFEQLRSLDLSVSQAARLIAQRDQRGGFSSPDELNGLYGLPLAVIATLRERTTV